LIVGGVVVVGAIAAAVALSGGGTETASPRTGTGGTTVPGGWTVHRDEAARFSIAFPGDWTDATEEAKGKVEGAEDFLKFAAVDPSTGANVSVGIESSGLLDIDGYARASERVLSDAGITSVKQSRAIVPAGKAGVFTYAGGPSGQTHITQYFLVTGGQGFIVTFTAPGEDFDPTLLRQFMNSFELLD
jgi:hypothetical protein